MDSVGSRQPQAQECGPLKTPSNPAVTALLNSGEDYVDFDLWELTLVGGVLVRWAATEIDVFADGVLYSSIPIIERNNIEQSIGLAATSLTMNITADASDLIQGTPIVQFVSQHGLDGAYVKLRRGYAPSWDAPTAARQSCIGTVVRFAGKVTSADDVSGNTARVTVASWSALLNVNAPPNLFQTGCNWSVYDVNCGVSPASFQVAGTVSAGATQTSLPTSLSSAVTGYFDQGEIRFTSGNLSGLSFTVKQNVTSVVSLVTPTPVAPVAGDTFVILPGCDLTNGAGGCAKFNNQARFRGFQYIPVPETAI